MAKRKNKPRSKTPEEIERRQAVRAYAAPLIAEMLRKQQSNHLPDDTLKRTIAIGCIRWAILLLEQEDRYCTMEDDVDERQLIQSEIEDGEAA